MLAFAVGAALGIGGGYFLHDRLTGVVNLAKNVMDRVRSE